MSSILTVERNNTIDSHKLKSIGSDKQNTGGLNRESYMSAHVLLNSLSK